MPIPQRHDMQAAYARWRRLPKMPLLVLGGFAIGLLLFLAFWSRDRGSALYRADVAAAPEPGQRFEPLPAPLPVDAARSTASGLPAIADAPAQPPPRMLQTLPVRPAASAAAPAPAAIAMAGDTAPQPIQMPAPAYPPEALRNGESGTALMRVLVDPGGMPYAVELVRSSGSRALDRAASDALRRWRFRPALRGGQPVAGEVEVPIAFTADR